MKKNKFKRYIKHRSKAGHGILKLRQVGLSQYKKEKEQLSLIIVPEELITDNEIDEFIKNYQGIGEIDDETTF